MSHYAGIGSRKTPREVLALMSQLASKLEGQGYILRSGGATGADQAFQAGVQNPLLMEIYLPWEGFSGFSEESAGIVDASKIIAWEQARAMVLDRHPAGNTLQESAIALLARNTFQVLGKDLKTPSDFVIAWTPGGRLEGGSGYTLQLAQDWGIQVRNLGSPDVLERAKQFLDG